MKLTDDELYTFSELWNLFPQVPIGIVFDVILGNYLYL